MPPPRQRSGRRSGGKPRGSSQDTAQDVVPDAAQDLHRDEPDPPAKEGSQDAAVEVEEEYGTDPTASLPNEMLLLLFRHLDNAQLMRARQVCRRWRDLAATGLAWRHRELRSVHARDERQRQAVAVFRRAPCLRRLSVDGWFALMLGAGSLPMPAVRSVELFMSRGDLIKVRHLLCRQAALGQLKELTFRTLSMRPGDVRPFVALVDRCRPDRLCLCFVKYAASAAGSGDIAEFVQHLMWPLPAPRKGAYLRELTFLIENTRRVIQPGRATLLRHLLRAHARTLQAVRFWDARFEQRGPQFEWLPLRPPAAWLAGCDRLERLACSVLDGMEGLLLLPRLETLELTVMREDWGPAAAFMRGATRLRRLVFEPGPTDTMTSVREGAEAYEGASPLHDTALRLLEALGSSGCSALESLEVRRLGADPKPEGFWAELAAVLFGGGGFPSLREVCIDCESGFEYAVGPGTASFKGRVDDDVLQFLRVAETAFPLHDLDCTAYDGDSNADAAFCGVVAAFARLERLACPAPAVGRMASLAQCPRLADVAVSVCKASWQGVAAYLRRAAPRLRRLRLRLRWSYETCACGELAWMTAEGVALHLLEALAAAASPSSLEALHLDVTSERELARDAYWERLADVVADLGELRELQVVEHHLGPPAALPPAAFLRVAAARLRVLRLPLPALRCTNGRVGGALKADGAERRRVPHDRQRGLAAARLATASTSAGRSDDGGGEDDDEEEEVDDELRFVEELGRVLAGSAMSLVGLGARCVCPASPGPLSRKRAVTTMGQCRRWRRRAPRELRDVRPGQTFNVCGGLRPPERASRWPGKWVHLGGGGGCC